MFDTIEKILAEFTWTKASDWKAHLNGGGYVQITAKVDATAQIGTSTYLMFGQSDGAWIKNAAEEPQLVEAMRKGAELIIKGKSARGTETTDTYSLMGISNALDRAVKECGGSG